MCLVWSLWLCAISILNKFRKMHSIYQSVHVNLCIPNVSCQYLWFSSHASELSEIGWEQSHCATSVANHNSHLVYTNLHGVDIFPTSICFFIFFIRFIFWVLTNLLHTTLWVISLSNDLNMQILHNGVCMNFVSFITRS